MRELDAEFRAAEFAIEANDASERFLVRVRIESEAHRGNPTRRLDRGGLGDRQPQIGQGIGPEMNRVPALGLPSCEAYWHIGESTMRLSSVNPRSVMGENSLLAVIPSALVGSSSDQV
jgi:hypothetical protein